jgi:hypothetical protein
MLKVIDLDNQGKDEGFVFVLSISGEKIGVTDQEVMELIKQKYSNVKSAKRTAAKKTTAQDSSNAESQIVPMGDQENRMESSQEASSEGSHAH